MTDRITDAQLLHFVQEVRRQFPNVSLHSLSVAEGVVSFKVDVVPVKVSDLTPTTEEMEFVHRGQMINAIKAVRQRANLTLKEAKDLVEGWRANKIPF